MLTLAIILLLLQYDWVYAILLTTPSGRIEGSLLTSRLGKTIYSFRGIRYAEAPVGELRLQPPVAIETWNGTYDATKDGPMCPQYTIDHLVSGDCLMANVYSTELPKGKSNPKRPVIIYILGAGGSHVSATSDMAGPQYFMDQDIVLITFNYRLGHFGFLATGDKEAPGNNGLKDQVVLLKWVQKNIASFGGDPDSVTLLGYLFGSWSVILHMVSPMSKGLFHKAFAISGSPVGSWHLPGELLHMTKRLVDVTGCPDDTSKNIVKCLKTKSLKDLKNSWLFLHQSFPVIEPDVGQERFITDDPVRLIMNGHLHHVPFIIGQPADELLNKTFIKGLMEDLNEDWDIVAPKMFMYENGTDQPLKVSRAIRKFYLNDKPMSETNIEASGRIFADSEITFPVNRAVKLMAQYNSKPVYYYRFSFKGRYTYCEYSHRPLNESLHEMVPVDDIMYLFSNQEKQILKFNATSPRPEIDMVEKLTTLHTNFACE